MVAPLLLTQFAVSLRPDLHISTLLYCAYSCCPLLALFPILHCILLIFLDLFRPFFSIVSFGDDYLVDIEFAGHFRFDFIMEEVALGEFKEMRDGLFIQQLLSLPIHPHHDFLVEFVDLVVLVDLEKFLRVEKV